MPVEEPLMLSVSEIARAKGVTAQAISKRVKRFVAEGRLETRELRGQKMVPLADYDRLVGETTDFGRARPVQGTDGGGAETGRAVEGRVSTDENPIYTQEQARKARYDADLRAIELGKARREILLTADVERDMARCAEAMVRRIDLLPALAEDCAAAVARNGADGARQFLRAQARLLREAVGEEFRLLAALGERSLDDADEELADA